MNNGILSAQSFSIGIDSVGIKPLLGVPQSITTQYHFPPNTFWRVASDDGTSSEDYVIVIDTTKGSSTTISFNILGQLGGSYEINWGDGNYGVFLPTNATNMSRPGSFETRLIFFGTTNFTGSHTYACHGIYVISIKGVFGTTAATVTAPVVSPVATVISVLNYGSNNNKLSSLSLYSTATNLISVPKNIPTGITSLSNAFNGATNFNSPNVSFWGVSNVTNFASTFFNATSFNQDISSWASKLNRGITSFSAFCQGASRFNNNNQPLTNWDIPSGCDCTSMFRSTNMTNIDMSGWTFGGNVNANFMFGGVAPANLDTWNSAVTGISNMNNMFANSFAAATGLKIENWDVSNVTNMNSMLVNCSINQNLSNWNVSKVTDFTNFLLNGGDNRNLSGWNIASGCNCTTMFSNNTSLTSGYYGNWIFNSNNINCTQMFNNCPTFRGSGLDNWSVVGISNASGMFNGNSLFSGDLSSWNLCNCNNLTNFMAGCNIGSGNYDKLLNSWSVLVTGNPVKNWSTTLTPHFGTTKYTSAGSGARQRLINYGWTITDGGLQT